MGIVENCANTRLGSRRLTVRIPRLHAALKGPLRAAELEAMSSASRISPVSQARPALDLCFLGLAMRAPLLCAMFRPR